MEDIFHRNEHNPLIEVDDLPYPANAVFNAGAADLGDEVLLLLRVESRSGRSHLTVARSQNGITDWHIEDRPLLHPDQGSPYEAYGVEDCRITWIEDLQRWGLAYTAFSSYGPAVALATTADFKSVERLGVAFPPNNKDAAIFPRKIGGKYAILHRPRGDKGNIWIAYSTDLIHWGQNQVVLPIRSGPWWDGAKVGTGLPPIETDKGWLLIYHGIKNMVGGPIYRVGAALLDLDDPHRLLARAHHWILGPQAPYERTGDVANVVFPCGGIVRNGELWMYYGAADSSICLAQAKISDILDYLLADPRNHNGY